jgi:hypothetical protein
MSDNIGEIRYGVMRGIDELIVIRGVMGADAADAADAFDGRDSIKQVAEQLGDRLTMAGLSDVANRIGVANAKAEAIVERTRAITANAANAALCFSVLRDSRIENALNILATAEQLPDSLVAMDDNMTRGRKVMGQLTLRSISDDLLEVIASNFDLCGERAAFNQERCRDAIEYGDDYLRSNG